ncbi:cyclophilin-like domain-containing protein, partial [Ochromonadaceae sp. CCMP2298]
YLEISIGGNVKGRLVFKLCDVHTPNTSANFRALCKGGGVSGAGYKGSIIHSVAKGFGCHGGDYVNNDGTGGLCAAGHKVLPDESFAKSHSGRGVLSMANQGWPHSNGSQFFITFGAATHLNDKSVAFGDLIDGAQVLREIEEVATENTCIAGWVRNGRPCASSEVRISDCG